MFSVHVEGGPFCRNLDVFREAGILHAIVKEKTVTAKDGILDITFRKQAQETMVNAIEILPAD